MKVETRFILTLANREADVNQWSQRIGIVPSKAISKGDEIITRRHSRVADDSCWVYEISRSVEASVESQVENLIKQVYAKKDQILSLVQDEKLEVDCETFIWLEENENLTVNFSPELMRKITELGAAFTLTRY